MRFSASVDFLWPDRPLPDGIRAAQAAGFAAVECHWPYETAPAAVRAALEETGLAMLALNTSRGDVAAGEFGLSALPGREAEARAAIDAAFAYAEAIGAEAVHVMAGRAEGAAAEAAFLDALRYASDRAGPRTVLIEPLNPYDATGYLLARTDQAAQLLEALGRSNVRLMFDCYHAQRSEGEVANRLARLLPLIGHIQIAGAPDRGPPDASELDYRFIFQRLQDLGYAGFIGAEYRPGARAAEETFGWMGPYRGESLCP